MLIPTRMVSSAAFAVAVLAAVVSAAPAQMSSPRQLSDQRWHDRAYGLSLRPPLGTQLQTQTADDYLLRLGDETGHFAMSVIVKRSRSVLTIEQVAKTAREQVFSVQGTSKILDERTAVLAKHPAVVIYARMPQAKGPEILLGQAIVQLDPRTYAVLEARCHFKYADPVRTTFEAMIESLQVTDPKETDRQRQEALERGRQWRESLSIKQLHACLIPEQTFRLLRDGNDFGYMQVRQTQVTRNGEPGIEVEVRTRVVANGFNVESLATYFLADNDSTETWSVRTTQRQAGAKAPAPGDRALPDPNSVTFLETGIRAGGEVTVIVESPYGNDRSRFERPLIGYLSQVEAWLLPQLLPVDRPITYGFYCYNSKTSALTFRTEQVVPTLSGFTLNTRLSPNDNPLKAVYDAQRNLADKQLGANQEIVPATPAMVRQIWQNR